MKQYESNASHKTTGDSTARRRRGVEGGSPILRQIARLQAGAGRAAVVSVALLLAACGPNPNPSPRTSQVSPSPSPSPSPLTPTAEQLAFEACDLTGYVPCEHQAVLLKEQVAGTGVALTYSSEWAPGRTDRRGWGASAEGLGGWSLDVLQRYDPTTGVLLSGDGSWRFATGVPLLSGERVVPSYDGSRAYVFDKGGRHVRTVDALLGTTLVTFAYDPAGRLSSARGSLDGTPIKLAVNRDGDGTPSSLVGVGDATTTLLLGSDAQLESIGDPGGQATDFTTSSAGLVSTFFDASGGVTSYEYDDAGRLTSATDPDGVVVKFQRISTADSVEIRMTTTLNRVTTYRTEVSATGRIQAYTGPDGTRTSVSTDPSGQHQIVLPDGTRVAFGAQPDPRWGMDSPITSPVDEIRPDGVIRHTTVAVAVTTEPGDPLTVSAWSLTADVGSSRWVEKADPAAHVITWSDPAGRTTVQTYDTAGRLVTQTAPRRPDLSLAYDDQGRISTWTSGSGTNAATTTYAYDVANGTVDVTQPDGLVEHGTFDAAGRLVRQTAADGSAVLTTYDGVGRLVRIAPAGQPSTTIGYSAAGRQTGFLPPTVGSDGSYETQTYDQDGNAVAISGPGDRSIVYAYDDSGRISGWKSGGGEATASYDPITGLLRGTTAPGGIGVTISYVGGIPSGASVSGPISGAVAVTLDPEGRVAGESINGAAPIGYTYDAAWLLSSVGNVSLQRDPASGQISTATLGVVKTSRLYDAQGRPSRTTASVSGSPTLDLQYAYDLRGRVTSVTQTRAGSKATRTTYTYDGVGRLAAISVDGTQVELDSYDVAGNRVAVKTSSSTLAAMYDERDRLQQWGTAKYTFRPDGQLAGVSAAGATTSYAFDAFGALQEVTLPEGRRVQYLVDAGGARVGKRVDGALVAGYLYAPNGSLVAQLDGSGSVVARFGFDDTGRLTLVERGSARYQVVTDHLGSPLLVIDATSGEVAEAITYDAWGTVTSDTNPGFIPVGFAGGLRDADTGLTQFGAREYDPRTGRWTGPDPIRYEGGDAILYRYLNGDPLNGTDLSGLSSIDSGSDHGHFHVPPPRHGGGSHGSPPPKNGTEAPNNVTNPPNNVTNPPNNVTNPPKGSTPPRHPPSGSCLGTGDCRNARRGFNNGVNRAGKIGGYLCRKYCSHGDPHERTGDGMLFDFQAAGEFQMAASSDKSVVIQVRLEPFGTSTIATLGSAVAVSVAGDRVAVYANDKVPLTIAGKTETRHEFSERLPHGGIVERHGSLVTIEWPGGSRLAVSLGRRWLDFSFDPTAAIAPTLRGLLGSADGNPANDFTTHDGTVIDENDPAFATKLYDPFGASWRITQAESLFDYGPGQSTATFTKPDIPHAPATIDSLDATTRSKAEELCRAMGVTMEPTLTNCILDVGITGDSSYAASAAAVQVSTAGPLARSAGLDTGSPLAIVAKATGTIAKSSQIDRTTFSAKAGDVVYFDAQGACVNGLNWRLTAPSGSHLSLGHACDDLGRFALPEAGTYTVEVYTDNETATGAYKFQIIGAPPERTSSISLGQTISDRTTWVGEWHRYTFDARAGQVIYLDGQGACVNGLLWRLVGPSRNMTLGHSCDDLGRIELPEAGTYAVEVYADNTAAGAYTFQLRSSE